MRLVITGYLSIRPPFQFTHPGKGATVFSGCGESSPCVSIHAPWEGCDRACADAVGVGGVSIHAPWEGCDTLRALNVTEGMVSIHAPWEGCDLYLLDEPPEEVGFQFTHPGKGATSELDKALVPDLVSIHAPWEGCDASSSSRTTSASAFQFTHPGKGATKVIRPMSVTGQFQFTHPGKGATQQRAQHLGHSRFQFTHPGKGATNLLKEKDYRNYVSIHAPWEGCDDLRRRRLTRLWRFNSRTLGRVRRYGWRFAYFSPEFQFTHPGKGATRHRTTHRRMGRVSIHAPWEGCDMISPSNGHGGRCFNSRTLGRVRPLQYRRL